MPIHSAFEQREMPIEEYFSEKQMGSQFRFFGKEMQSFISVINKLFPVTMLYGRTSHYRLIIQNKDHNTLDWLIIVSVVAGEYYFEYLMPKETAPWQNAYVRGTATTLEEAERYLLIAMRECKGWHDSLELRKRLQEFDLQRTTQASQNGS